MGLWYMPSYSASKSPGVSELQSYLLTIIHVLWHLWLFVLSVLHHIVHVTQYCVDRVFVRRIERKERDEILIFDLPSMCSPIITPKPLTNPTTARFSA